MTDKGYYLLEKVVFREMEEFKFVCGSSDATIDKIVEDILTNKSQDRDFIVAKEIPFQQGYSFKVEETKDAKTSKVNVTPPKLEEGTYFLLTEREDYTGRDMSNPYPEVTRSIDKYDSKTKLLRTLVVALEYAAKDTKNTEIHILKPVKVSIDYTLEAE